MRSETMCSLFLNPVTGMVYFAFPQPTSSSPACEVSDMCVSYEQQPLNVWYLWVFLLLLLLLVLRCVVTCCLQCWIKRCSAHPPRRTVTVVTLSSSDSIYVTESSQCPHSLPGIPPLGPEASSAPSAVRLGGLQPGAPPSYEELFKTSKL
ncbi:transmembrane protein 207 [Ascaphus truei]|uniref:transmembrane protein 207 n=1 Tax=Ascaphus truei TaxID=8439 RepID=UPI003F5A0767